MQKLTAEEIVALAHRSSLQVVHDETLLTRYVTLSDGQHLVLSLKDRGHPDIGPDIISAMLTDGEDRYEFSAAEIEKLSWQFVDGLYDCYTGWLENHWFEKELRKGLFDFATAPKPARDAILLRLGEYGSLPEVEDEGDVFAKEELARNIELALKEVGVAFIEVPVKDVSSTVTNSNAWREDASAKPGETWETYHAWYIQKGVPDYPSENRWPALAGRKPADEVFEDGWHRLHSYFRSGHGTIPVVAFDRRAAHDALDRLRRDLEGKRSDRN
jgi:hypothetical protein